MAYALHDGPLLRHLMRNPGPGGAVQTVQSLADVAGISRSKMYKVLAGSRPAVSGDQADLIAAAVGVAVGALFLPSSSPFANGDQEEETMDPQDRALRARLAAHTQWAKTKDRTARTAKARAAAEGKFVQQARELHPEGDDALIQRTAQSLRQAHFARMGMRSGAARRRGAARAAA